MNKSYASEINARFRANADAATAEAMSKYMRDQFPMYGIKRPLRNEIQKAFLNDFGLPAAAELPEILSDLWAFEARESQLFGVDLVKRLYKKQPIEFIKVIEGCIVEKSWWDTVDLLATTAGQFMQRHPTLNPKVPNQWIQSSNFWLQRSAILFQLKYREETNWPLLQRYILKVATSSEFFLQKASGWALREYSKRHPGEVQQFIDNHHLSQLTIREGSKYLT